MASTRGWLVGIALGWLAGGAQAAYAADLAGVLDQGASFEAAGRLEDALHVYDSAVAIDVNAPLPRLRRALLRVRQGDCANALTDLDAYTRLTPVADRVGPSWSDAILKLAQCRRASRAVIEVTSDRDAECRVDGGVARRATVASPLLLEVDPGEHVIRCLAGELAYQERLNLGLAERVPLTATYGERGKRLESAPSKFDGQTAASVDPPKEEAKLSPPPEPPRLIEWSLGGGFGPSRGAFGVSAGLRVGSAGLSVGSGFFPVGVEGTWFFRPGITTPYVSAGYMRLGRGLVGGSEEAGHEVFVLGGFDIRPIPQLSIRVGGGLAYLTTRQNAGPLTFETAVFWVL